MLTALVLPAGGAGAPAPGSPILGVPWIARTVLSAERGGFDAVVLAPREELAEIRRALTGARAAVLEIGTPPEVAAHGRLAVISARVLAQPRLFRELASMRVERGRLYTDGGDVTLLETDDVAGAARLAAGASSASEAFARLAGRFPVAGAALAESNRFVVASSADLPAAKRWLLGGLVKDTEGFLARHVSRKISLAVSRVLAGTSVTPNAMTGVSVALGLLGAVFFLSPTRGSQVAGAVLFLLHSILDGCDGELARLKFQESRLGGILDFWGDNVVHVAVFSGLAVGWSRAVGAPWPLWLGASASIATILSAGFVYLRTMRRTREGPLFTSVAKGPGGGVSRLADELARRDFIYGVPVLALFGKASWLLAAAAVGSPIFLAVLLWIAAKEGRREATAGEAR